MSIHAGCVAGPQPPRPGLITNPTTERFSICYGYGCREFSTLTLDNTQRHSLQLIFDEPPRDAGAERKRIAVAIAWMERWVGALTATDHDLGGTFPGAGKPGQMDCIDESANTTTYLTLFATHGWLRMHSVEPRMTRGFPPLSWPHTTAVIRAKDNGQHYAVDSWFLDNGQAPYIMPLEIWKSGWKPPH